ncbi:MAG: serine/threonine-protein kinase [Kofleriaceae bacterium]
MQDDLFDADETTIEAKRFEDVPRYELLERIGLGGMAAVYRARQRTVCGFERLVALKRIVPERAHDPAYVEWFIREAKIASALSHSNIVQIYDFGRDAEGYFIAMEYLEGRSLQELLSRAFQVSEQAPIDVVLAIARELCDAIDHIHQRCGVDGRPLEIIHRDVSCANLFVTTTGHLKLIDFGIAAARNAPWRRNVLVGKLSYMAPETIRGAELDGRVDVFAAGVVLWQLLCGCGLFSGGEDLRVIDKVLTAEIVAPSVHRADCPPGLDAVILAMLARDRDQRPDAAAVRAMIDAVIEPRGHAVSAATVARWFACVIAGTGRPSTPPATVSSPQPILPQWRPSRRSSLVTRFAVVASIVGGWFTVSALATTPTPTPMPSPPLPVIAAVAPPAGPPRVEAPPLPEPKRVEKSPRRASRHAVHRVTTLSELTIAKPVLELAPIVVPPVEPNLPVIVLPRPAPARSLTIPPDRVHQRSGRLPALDLRRAEREGLGRRFVVTLCIDDLGKVASVRYLGSVPAWAQQALTPSLRAFSFTPYVVDGAAAAACFTRDLALTAGGR